MSFGIPGFNSQWRRLSLGHENTEKLKYLSSIDIFMVRNAKIDIHDYQKQLDLSLARIREDPEISSENKKIIHKFYERLLSDNLSTPRVVYYTNKLALLAKWLGKSFEKATREDIEKLTRRLNQMPYTEWTKKDYRVTLKKFYKWLRGIDERGVYPPEVSWINTHISHDRQELPNNLPNEEDMKKMLEVAEHPRDKALLAGLYESGCRVGEIASLRVKDVHFDEYGAFMVVNGKTGSRRIRLVFSAPILASWLNVHPDKDKPDAPLWVVIGTTKKCCKGPKKEYKYEWSYSMKYSAIASMIRKTAQRAGIKKRVNPHSWRHARATFLANKLTEQQLKHLFGWGQSSKMAGTYVHLSGRDVDDALLAVYGKKRVSEQSKDSALSPAECPRCKEVNEYSNVFCKRCGWVLDKKAAVSLEEKRKEADKIISALTRDPESMKEIARAIARLGLVEELKKV